MGDRRSQTDVRVALVICVCFLLTSTGWLSWLYHIIELDPSAPADLLTMVFGYLMQALGIGLYVRASRRGDCAQGAERPVMAAIVLYVLLLLPFTMAGTLVPVVAYGLLSNIPCGIIQGWYLCVLASYVTSERQGTVFGSAYAASTLLTWLLSLPARGVLTRGMPCVVVCVVMAVVAMALARGVSQTRSGGQEVDIKDGAPDGKAGATATVHTQGDSPDHSRELLGLACAVVVLASLVKTAGFSFPSVDLSAGVSLEFSRLLYGFGLVVAGLASDRDRRYGMLFCVVALVTPFLMLALSGAGASGTLLWATGYFLTGFFAVFRVLLMVDLSNRLDMLWFAALGLLLGRVGDALGTVLFLLLDGMPVVLIVVTAAVFVATIRVFVLLYQRLYQQPPEPAAPSDPSLQDALEPQAVPEPSERKIFEEFAAAHGLTARERDVLRLVLAERSNSEIAGELFVSEATVKYHVGNLLKKTECKSRLDILAKYARRT